MQVSVGGTTRGNHKLGSKELKKRLREGDQLESNTGGGAYRIWAELFASPPPAYCEGVRHDLKNLETVVRKIIEQLEGEDVRAKWVEDDN